MASLIQHHIRRFAGWATLGLGISSLLLIAAALLETKERSSLQARIRRAEPSTIPIYTYSPQQFERGVTVPPNAHVTFTLPTSVDRITREVLLGRRGDYVRYWGYCFPTNDGERLRAAERGIPGTLFLSELEQEKQALAEARNPGTRSIRHEKEVFLGGERCYIMTDQPLPMGLDTDGDTANIKVESAARTSPRLADTDGDGISDGVEIFGKLKTNPLSTDSDGDGIPDGTEDANKNGQWDTGETSPMNRDSDGDGLCDGYCVESDDVSPGYAAPVDFVPKHQRKATWEDKNLNGTVDEGETDPRTEDTDGDGILDIKIFEDCIFIGGSDCQ